MLAPLTAVAFTTGVAKLTNAPTKGERENQAQPRPTASAGDGMMLARYTTAKNSSRRQAVEPQATQAAPEIVTEFMPLTYGAALNPNEGGQLVRVELPRSALASLGLPVNVERSNERVKADVLLGHDGLARAIRFVR
jgi:hypothetical protein